MIDLFFSYSHKDEALRDELETHLAMLRRQGLVRVWHDRRIAPGGDIDSEVSEHLEEADVILLLVSPYFLASDYCYDVEMRRALERHESGDAVVIPVILEPSDWQNSPFRRLRATPTDGKPVSKFANIHEAFLQVTQDVRWAADQLGKAEKREPQTKGPTLGVQTNPGVRSSNLRVKKEFSDRERDEFVDKAFEYIALFFENSLEELGARNPSIETRFKRYGEGEFTAAVYSSGEKKTSCRIWLPGSGGIGGDIAYSANEDRRGTGFNDSMHVADDDHQLGLRPLGLSHWGGRQSQELLTPHGAAEYFWSVLVSPVQ